MEPSVTRRQLLDAIRLQPADDELRLAYARALADEGDLEQAEFIRLQIAIARDEAEPADVERALHLEAEHGKRFAGAIAELATAWTFERGLVASIESDLVVLGEHGAALRVGQCDQRPRTATARAPSVARGPLWSRWPSQGLRRAERSG